MISVSVAMATHNGERFIREQLESLAAQDCLPSELVITDDGSEDQTVAIAEQFAKSAPFRVNIYRGSERLGFRANFMRAANLCACELIAFCDQDDVWSPRKLARCIEPFRDPTVLLAYHNAHVVTEAGEPHDSLDHFGAAPIRPPLSCYPIRWMQYPLGFTEVFHRSILKFSDLWQMSSDYCDLTAPMGHDQWVFFIASVFGSIAYIDEALVSYRQHGANTVGWGGRPHTGLLINPCEAMPSLRQVAERCASILEKATDNLVDEWRHRAIVGAPRYRLLAEFYTAREELYRSPVFSERVKAFHRIISTGGYRPMRMGGLGRIALARDFCLGLPAAHLLKPSRDRALFSRYS
jgi:glycosyltransferase involved in cell wall biosynthesis